MSKKYSFTMVVVKPTGKGGKPLKPKPIKPKPQQKAGGGMSNKPKKPKIIQLMPKGVFYKGKAKDYPGIKEIIKRKNKKALGGEMLKNPKKADLDKDGKLSSYEKKRGMAIEKNMKPKKANLGMLMMKKAKDKGAKGAEFLSPLAMLRRATKKEGGEITSNKPRTLLKKFTPEESRRMMQDPKRKERLKKLMEAKKAQGKMGGGMMKYSRGGGADTGKMGETKSKLSVALDKLKKSGVMGRRPKPKLQAPERAPMKPLKKSTGGEMKRGYGAARTSGMGLQDENLTPGKTMDYYKDLM